ncbi:uncharacterized protein PV07_03756 [Cladophialophora immunda]|uniref:Asteroid domain-containing protein n=1 Tax=Cladophialophora immunda TaxID=569365 RepID=A0A0D2B3K9_9EURO|nr:uncharacterized protein PV07_03756 [Cladophialophora immunda]KIW32197.1 hypothetical protein PV07_03756 [Cladophialophora immunda]
MGIPRLSQDLSPYADHVVLGSSPQSSSLPLEATIVRDLIIDGPSLVYWVYNKLVAHQRLSSLTSATLPPTYLEINRMLHRLLDDFQAHGISIQHIFFDGGLPVSKRNVRLERMEKLRQQLETYRKLYPEFPPVAALPDHREWERILWDTPVLSTRKSTLPAPPLMVASAIESLKTTVWKDRVHVVPGEADAFCALAAQRSTPVVAILTNDSDLAVHDLGANGRVVLLHSIEIKHKGPHRESYISAMSLDPKLIASRLKVSSLLGFGFERSLDSGASFAVIQERARDSSRLERLQNEYMLFAEPFTPTLPPTANPLFSLENIDPRTAEIVSNPADPPHIYLTPLLEDPQRDSSWSYGAKIRQIAYSLLLKTSPGLVARRWPHVVECARKGQRITSVSVPCLQVSEITEQAEGLLQVLDAYISPCEEYPSVPNWSTLLAWHSLAVDVVQQEKSSLGKPPPTSQQILQLLGLGSTALFSPRAPRRVTWDDIHLLANLHAVLYSVRMLAQITEYIIRHPNACSDDTAIHELAHRDAISKLVNKIHARLSTSPPIQRLFLDIPHLRAQLSNMDLEKQNLAIASFKRLLNPNLGVDRVEEHEASDGATTGEPGSIPGEWVTTTSSSKTKRKRKRKRQGGSETAAVRSTNGFDVLSEEPG